MSKQTDLKLDFTKIWPGGIDAFADTKSTPPPKPPKKKES